MSPILELSPVDLSMRPLALFAALVAVPVAGACSVIVGAPHSVSLWHWFTDHRAPTPPDVVAEAVDLRRGIGPRDLGNGTFATSSCDDLGSFALLLRPSSDGRTAASEIGYEVEVVGGRAPAGLVDGPIRTLAALPASGRARLPFAWVDGATDAQEALDVSLVVRAVDRAGNRSAPSDTVRVAHPGFAPGTARRGADGRRL